MAALGSVTTGNGYVFFGFHTEAVREERSHHAIIAKTNEKTTEEFEKTKVFARRWLDVTAVLACIPGANVVAAISAVIFGVAALWDDDNMAALKFFGMAAANLIYPVGCFMHLGGALYQNWGTIANFFGSTSGDAVSDPSGGE